MLPWKAPMVFGNVEGKIRQRVRAWETVGREEMVIWAKSGVSREGHLLQHGV